MQEQNEDEQSPPSAAASLGDPKFVPLSVPMEKQRLTHYLFRYPAKFHPPVVRTLLERYTESGQVVLDPFCGSGTLLVEAVVMGRTSVGVDIDPLAVAVANAKVQRFDPAQLEVSAMKLWERASQHRRSTDEYEQRKYDDLAEVDYQHQVASISRWVPAIPNLFHWFRRYVIIDLARIRESVELTDIPEDHRAFFRVVFAGIIRNASNADPVPVSGLEVTKWMKEREAKGRIVDPFQLFEKALRSSVKAAEELATAASRAAASALHGDATELDKCVRQKVDAVITSPPYHGAVDYYRRHQLEMFWLGLTITQDDRLKLLQRYIGRPNVPPRHPWVAEPLSTALAKEWEDRIREISRDRANQFRHYLTSMTRSFAGIASCLQEGAPTLLVVGDSAWNKSQIPTTDLMTEIAGDAFELEEVLTYPVKNRYMSYSRRNQADINTEYVLVMRRNGTLLGNQSGHGREGDYDSSSKNGSK